MTIPPDQQDVARFLTELAGRPPTETHISAVFIGADTVWKLKKAVRMPFLDFTTLEARQRLLRRELDLNKPAAPGLYRDVAGIVRGEDGRLALGEDDPIEYVLRMAPVADADFLDVIAAEHRLAPALLDALGDAVAAYHAALTPVANQDSAASMLRITEGNAKSALAVGLAADEVDTWRRRMEAAIAAQHGWLTARAASGFVRRCHGDLHLGNLCLWEGRPVPFDALEFDEALATIDVGYDLAFLLMDLDRRVDRAAANRVMNRYVARTGDAGLVAGLKLFMSQRAMIRAHVLTSMQQDGSGYFAAARGYLAPVAPVVVAIGGLPGTGKSTLARALAPELGPAPGALVLRSDEMRKRLHGAAPEARLPAEAYGADANAATNETLIEQVRVAAQGGHAVIADATFLDCDVRARLEGVMRQLGVRFVGFWLQGPLSVLEQRIEQRTGDASDATVAVLRRAASNYPGAGGWLAVDATDAAQALQVVRAGLV